MARLRFLLAAACPLVGVAVGPYQVEPPSTEPNPPAWPDSVHVFSPQDANLSGTIAGLLSTLNDPEAGQFSSERLALLFKPGVYDNVSVSVGYYVQVLGLGERVQDVVFNGYGPYCLAMGAKPSPGSLNNFWRGAENFLHNGTWGMYWAVSQAAPLRRVRVASNLTLFDGTAWASGGFMADVQVDGATKLGGQQQWFTRNAKLNTPDPKVMGGAWNMVFVGTEGAPPSTYPNGEDQAPAYTNEPQTPIIAEKPYITIGEDGRYSLQVPPVDRSRVGASFDNLTRGGGVARSIPFEQVFVAKSGVHSAQDISAKLILGFHVVFSPGIYALSSTLSVSHPGQVLLGIGMATLVPPLDGSPCVRVASSTPGVRVAGLLFQAAATQATSTVAVSSLLEWGSPGVEDPGSPADPGVMSDLFMRAGGPGNDTAIGVDVMVRIHSGMVVGDNLWLWRADHTAGGHLTVDPEYHVKSGLEVVGRDVTMYGLFVEHTLEDLTVWRGEGGTVYFYQSELPYGIGPGDWRHSGYVVEDGVRSHQAYGVGVYSYFRDHPAAVESGIRAPPTDGVRFLNSFTRYLNGHEGILHVLNGKGPAATPAVRLARVARSFPWEPLPSPEGPGRPFVDTITFKILMSVLVVFAAVLVWECLLRRVVLKIWGRYREPKQKGRTDESSLTSSEEESSA